MNFQEQYDKGSSSANVKQLLMEQGICLHSVKILIKFRIFHYSIWSEGREILKKKKKNHDQPAASS